MERTSDEQSYVGNRIVWSFQKEKWAPVGPLGVLFAVAVIMVKTESGPEGSRLLVIFGLLAFVLFASMILIFLVSLILGRPKVVLSPEGLAFYEVIRTDTWRWQEVGPFVVFEGPSGGMPLFYLCAHTQRKHDVLRAAGKDTLPDLASADVKIPMFMLLDGRTLEAAIDLADRVNDWRNEYKAGRVPSPNPNDAKEADRLLADFQETRARLEHVKVLRIALIALIVGLIALRVFWWRSRRAYPAARIARLVDKTPRVLRLRRLSPNEDRIDEIVIHPRHLRA